MMWVKTSCNFDKPLENMTCHTVYTEEIFRWSWNREYQWPIFSVHSGSGGGGFYEVAKWNGKCMGLRPCEF